MTELSDRLRDAKNMVADAVLKAVREDGASSVADELTALARKVFPEATDVFVDHEETDGRDVFTCRVKVPHQTAEVHVTFTKTTWGE